MSRDTKTIILSGCLLLLVVVSAVFVYMNKGIHLSKGEAAIKLSTILVGTTTLSVEIARTVAEHQQGLSGRTSLEVGRGMLFVFDHPERYGFWMPDMHFPIDIIWINAQWQIVDIAASVSPDSYPKIFTPKALASYVLEVPSGQAKEMGWKEGTIVSVEGGVSPN